MKTWIWIAAAVLFLLHQDFWFWNDETLIFGFMPIGLGYHALYSVMAASLWALAIKFSWPDHLEQLAESNETTNQAQSNPTAETQSENETSGSTES